MGKFLKKITKKNFDKEVEYSVDMVNGSQSGFIIWIEFNFTAEETITAQGLIKHIELPDGSLAKLNPGSSIDFKRTFGWWNRNINMKGDVVFSVQKGIPFNVHSSEGKVEVLGTVFRVISFENYFAVSCKEGRVAVTHENKRLGLGAGNAYNNITRTVTSQNFDKFEKNEGLYYESTPLAYLVFVMEQVYGISVELFTSKPYYFTGVLPIKDKEEAFQILAETFSLQIKAYQNGNIDIVEP